MMYRVVITGLVSLEIADQLASSLRDAKNRPESVRITVEEIPGCAHSHYSDGHCAEMPCSNYVNKCKRHSTYGMPNEPCTLETVG